MSHSTGDNQSYEAIERLMEESGASRLASPEGTLSYLDTPEFYDAFTRHLKWAGDVKKMPGSNLSSDGPLAFGYLFHFAEPEGPPDILSFGLELDGNSNQHWTTKSWRRLHKSFSWLYKWKTDYSFHRRVSILPEHFQPTERQICQLDASKVVNILQESDAAKAIIMHADWATQSREALSILSRHYSPDLDKARDFFPKMLQALNISRNDCKAFGLEKLPPELLVLFTKREIEDVLPSVCKKGRMGRLALELAPRRPGMVVSMLKKGWLGMGDFREKDGYSTDFWKLLNYAPICQQFINMGFLDNFEHYKFEYSANIFTYAEYFPKSVLPIYLSRPSPEVTETVVKGGWISSKYRNPGLHSIADYLLDGEDATALAKNFVLRTYANFPSQWNSSEQQSIPSDEMSTRVKAIKTPPPEMLAQWLSESYATSGIYRIEKIEQLIGLGPTIIERISDHVETYPQILFPLAVISGRSDAESVNSFIKLLRGVKNADYAAKAFTLLCRTCVANPNCAMDVVRQAEPSETFHQELEAWTEIEQAYAVEKNRKESIAQEDGDTASGLAPGWRASISPIIYDIEMSAVDALQQYKTDDPTPSLP